MNENLIGHALQLNDAADDGAVTAHLFADPEIRRRLTLIERCVAPLALDGDRPPPPGLAARTIAKMAPGTILPSRWSGLALLSAPLTRARLSRPDAAVAACLLVVLSGLFLNWAARAQHRHAITACQNNLRQFHHALAKYSEEHSGEFPQVREAPPWNCAGAFVSMIQADGLLPPTATAACPANGPVRVTAGARPGVHYAYALGYRDEAGTLHGLRHGRGSDDGDDTPILADRAAVVGRELRTSPNHRDGYNVLFVGGHVRFCTAVTVGVGRDNIFLNDAEKVAAGLHRHDSVLGSCHDSP